MKVIKENEVYQLAFMPRLFPINCYLVEEEYYITIVDTGMPFCKNGIIKTAESIGKPIQKIVLTHAHSDHVGALDELKEQIPNAEVLLPKREEKILAGDVSLEEGEGFKSIRGGIPKNVKTKPDTLLEDGDRIGSLLAIHSPGHTPGMMSFLDTRSNTLIAGDAFQTKGGLAVSGDIRWSFPFPALATWDKDIAIRSAEKLLDYDPSVLMVGHGRMLHNPSNQIKEAIISAKNNRVSK
ncbi:MBL fold metallo-hydrolase [Pseudalkalibacillus salsuginis]|uniref:MBL fold metallo-hydrolase n=1 Tax=Pseudalkalibacillus salsuginis TaxID=2910972 RepID=UPI001F15E0CA|nr:MBL fold metallo-hydrolase [Pseudalkalibacillus salsuginis]MCF6409841.1 MBL fold metallo-hydrolase [Pseudalkalibacillus salsuginis]